MAVFLLSYSIYHNKLVSAFTYLIKSFFVIFVQEDQKNYQMYVTPGGYLLLLKLSGNCIGLIRLDFKKDRFVIEQSALS